ANNISIAGRLNAFTPVDIVNMAAIGWTTAAPIVTSGQTVTVSAAQSSSGMVVLARGSGVVRGTATATARLRHPPPERGSGRGKRNDRIERGQPGRGGRRSRNRHQACQRWHRSRLGRRRGKRHDRRERRPRDRVIGRRNGQRGPVGRLFHFRAGTSVLRRFGE